MKRVLWSLYLIVAIGSTCLAQENSDPIIARVNGAPIRQSELLRRLLRLRGADFLASASPVAFKNGDAGELVLQNIINEKLILDWGERTKDTPTDAELTAELSRVKEDPGVRQAIAKQLITEEYLKYELKVQMTRFNIATVAVSATPEEVEAYYKKNIARYSSPERWGLAIIRTIDSANLERVQKGLKEGKPFASLAKQYSDEAASARNGGDLGIIPATDAGIPLAARTALKALPIGETTPPIKMELERADGKGKVTAWVIFRLTVKLPEAAIPLENIRNLVKRDALLERVGGYASADKKIAEFRQIAQIEVLLPGYTDLSKQ